MDEFIVTSYYLQKGEEGKLRVVPTGEIPQKVETHNPFRFAVDQGWGDLPAHFHKDGISPDDMYYTAFSSPEAIYTALAQTGKVRINKIELRY